MTGASSEEQVSFESKVGNVGCTHRGYGQWAGLSGIRKGAGFNLCVIGNFSENLRFPQKFVDSDSKGRAKGHLFEAAQTSLNQVVGWFAGTREETGSVVLSPVSVTDGSEGSGQQGTGRKGAYHSCPNKPLGGRNHWSLWYPRVTDRGENMGLVMGTSNGVSVLNFHLAYSHFYVICSNFHYQKLKHCRAPFARGMGEPEKLIEKQKKEVDKWKKEQETTAMEDAKVEAELAELERKQKEERRRLEERQVQLRKGELR